jgi:hypothetical protein
VICGCMQQSNGVSTTPILRPEFPETVAVTVLLTEEQIAN